MPLFSPFSLSCVISSLQRDTLKVWVLSKEGKEGEGGKGGREWDEEQRWEKGEKTDETRVTLPRGTDVE